jgi:hypothetical protein
MMQRCHRAGLARTVVRQAIVSVLLVQIGRAAVAALGWVFASLWGGRPDRSPPTKLVPGRYGLVPVAAAQGVGAADSEETVATGPRPAREAGPSHAEGPEERPPLTVRG